MRKINLTGVCLLLLAGCTTKMVDIPSGYAAKILTPTGFQDKIYMSGQVNLGTLDNTGGGNTLIVAENTSIMITETFDKKSTDDDHRIILPDDLVPLAVDVRLSFMSPDFNDAANGTDKLFTLITPTKESDRIRTINLGSVYNSVTKMSVRSSIRKVFDKHGRTYKQAIKTVSRSMIISPSPSSRASKKVVSH